MLICFVIGLICGIGVALVVPHLLRRFAILRSRRYLVSAAVAAVIAAVAVIYFAGYPRPAPPVHAMSLAASPAPPAAAPSAQSMEAEIASLETRLARAGGSAADWTLLERAYEVLGRPQDAQRAREHIASPAAAPLAPLNAETLTAAAATFGTDKGAAAPAAAPVSPPAAPASATELERAVQVSPEDAKRWLALADLRRAQRDYQRARAALDKVIALHGMTAQSWADYADVSASLAGGSLAGQAGIAIDNALALDSGERQGAMAQGEPGARTASLRRGADVVEKATRSAAT